MSQASENKEELSILEVPETCSIECILHNARLKRHFAAGKLETYKNKKGKFRSMGFKVKELKEFAPCVLEGEFYSEFGVSQQTDDKTGKVGTSIRFPERKNNGLKEYTDALDEMLKEALWTSFDTLGPKLSSREVFNNCYLSVLREPESDDSKVKYGPFFSIRIDNFDNFYVKLPNGKLSPFPVPLEQMLAQRVNGREVPKKGTYKFKAYCKYAHVVMAGDKLTSVRPIVFYESLAYTGKAQDKKPTFQGETVATAEEMEEFHKQQQQQQQQQGYHAQQYYKPHDQPDPELEKPLPDASSKRGRSEDDPEQGGPSSKISKKGEKS